MQNTYTHHAMRPEYVAGCCGDYAAVAWPDGRFSTHESHALGLSGVITGIQWHDTREDAIADMWSRVRD